MDTASTSLSSINEMNPMSQQQQQEAFIQMIAPQRVATDLSSMNIGNLPCRDLFLGSRDDYFKLGIPLYNASMKGDWKAAEAILKERPELVGWAITENYETALHIASSTKRNKLIEKFVENLVDRMTKEQLELINRSGNTALCLTAAAGNVQIAKILVNKNRNLLEIPGSQKMMPLYMACLFGHREMVEYVYDNSDKMSGEFWTPQNRGWVLVKCVEGDLFDVALKIVTDREELTSDRSIHSVLEILARKPDAFREIKLQFFRRVINQIFAILHVNMRHAEGPSDAMKLLRIIWTNIAKLPKLEIDQIIRGPRDDNRTTTTDDKEKQDMLQLLGTISENIVKLPTKLYNLLKDHDDQFKKHEDTRNEKRLRFPRRVLFVAAENGNTEFVAELIRQYPDLIWKLNDDNQSIFHIAASYRHEGIYNLLYEIGSMKDMITPLKDYDGNTLLHIVGKSAKKNRLGDVSGYASQMQRELLWFKEVEAMMPPSYRERKNKDGLTPREVFTMEHKDLFFAGEKWMKDTASQCMVVAALIATIVFAAAFTVPGGYNQENGIPIFLHKKSFLVFVIADALSLTFSSISILIFLSIQIASYFEQDFLDSLPKKLMKGLATLFFSIASMMVAFGASFFVLYQNNLIWVPIIVSLFASVPVILYARLQYDLLGDFYRTTYDSKNLFKPKKPKLHIQNPLF